MRTTSSSKYAVCLLAILAVLSCKKDGSGDAIVFSPVEQQADTKALLDNEGLHTSGNRIRILDALTGFSGTASWMGDSPYYIDDELVYAGKPVWNFYSGNTYPWTVDGSHRFFGWLDYDADLGLSAEDFFGDDDLFDAANMVFTIPTLEMNEDTELFDFLYTGLPAIAAASRSSSAAVDLPLQHLFTAIGLTLNNTSGNTVLLKSVTLSGMKNIRGATITYTGSTPVVSMTSGSSGDVALFESSTPGGDSFVSADRLVVIPDDRPYLLMWPQSLVDLEDAQLEIEYVIRDEFGQDSDDLSAVIELDRQPIFSSSGMDAGTRYAFLLQFKKSTIDLYTRVLPWEYEEYDWDYAEHSISARTGTYRDGVLAFYRGIGNSATEPTSDEWAAKTMRFNTRSEIMTGRFYIEAPTSGIWQVSAYPLTAADYFIIEPASGEIDVETDDGKAEFTVSVNPERIPISTQTLYFNISIFFNGEWHDANSEFNRKNIKLVLDAN